MKLLFQILLFLLINYLSGCSNTKDIMTESVNNNDPEVLYSEALNEFESENYDLAFEKFHEIELKFPLSKEAIQSQILVAFVEYIRLEYDLAVLKLEKIIKRYPSYKDIDYVYYMKAICYYEQVANPELDGKFNVLALQSFEETIKMTVDWYKSYFAEEQIEKISTEQIEYFSLK